MTTYYIQENDKIVLYDTDLSKLQQTLLFTPQYKGLAIQQTEDLIIDGVIMTQEQYNEFLTQQEHERIMELFMTRGDFFAGTIRAFGADDEDLLPVIQMALEAAQIEEVEKKVALSYFRNALDFYRKHPLFAMLTDVPIPFAENVVVTITAGQWDKFFDETDKKNPDAYKELLPAEEDPSDAVVPGDENSPGDITTEETENVQETNTKDSEVAQNDI